MSVINMRRYREVPPTATYVGRWHPKIGYASDFANPYKARQESERPLAIQNYEKWLKKQDHLLERLDELRDGDLACWCDPKPCHAHVLEIILEMSPEELEEWRTTDLLVSAI